MGFKDTLSKTFGNAAEKSTELANKAKNKMEISSKKSAITALHKEIGVLVYEAREEEKDISLELEEMFSRIDKLKDEIQELEDALL